MKYLVQISFITVFMISISFFSCNKEENPEPITQADEIYDAESSLKRDFGKALATALADEPSLRAFIKTEALKMFDEDYDILYELVKDKKLDNGQTFRSILLNYFDNEAALTAIEQRFPLLTIFVPELPNDSFSAKNWDVSTQIPDVAIRLHTTNDVPMIKASGEEYVMKSGQIPAFPVVVIKENERMVSSKGKEFGSTKSSKVLTSKSGVRYKFTDDVFNRSLNNAKLIYFGRNSLDPKIVSADLNCLYKKSLEITR